MIRERSALDAIASEIRVSGQPIALDLETYGTSEDKKIRRDETLDPWRGEIRLLSLQLPDLVPWLIDVRATGYGLGKLGKVLEATEVIGHNIKLAALWLARKCNVHLVKMKSAGRVPNCTGCAVCFSRLLVVKRPRLRLRSPRPSTPQISRSRFHWRHVRKQPTQNIVGKKQARQEDEDSEYLLVNSSSSQNIELQIMPGACPFADYLASICGIIASL